MQESENNIQKKAQQALYEHLLSLISIEEAFVLKVADEVLLTDAILKTYQALTEKERFDKSGGSNNERAIEEINFKGGA